MNVESITHVYKRNPFHDKMFVNVAQEKCVHRLHLVHKYSSMREEDKYISNLNQGYGGGRANSIGVWFEDPPGAARIKQAWLAAQRPRKAFVNGVLVTSGHGGI